MHNNSNWVLSNKTMYPLQNDFTFLRAWLREVWEKGWKSIPPIVCFSISCKLLCEMMFSFFMHIIMHLIRWAKQRSHLSHPVLRWWIFPISPLIISSGIAKTVQKVASASTRAGLSKIKKMVMVMYYINGEISTKKKKSEINRWPSILQKNQVSYLRPWLHVLTTDCNLPSGNTNVLTTDLKTVNTRTILKNIIQFIIMQKKLHSA